jgi:monovalent cation:H+ antiporter-2, CPA2 family
MFGVGLHFSFHDLAKVHIISIPGAVLQTVIATLLGFGMRQL